MNREELSKELIKKRIPHDAYSLFGGLPNESFCIAEEKQWEVYYRGKRRSYGNLILRKKHVNICMQN